MLVCWVTKWEAIRSNTTPQYNASTIVPYSAGIVNSIGGHRVHPLRRKKRTRGGYQHSQRRSFLAFLYLDRIDLIVPEWAIVYPNIDHIEKCNNVQRL